MIKLPFSLKPKDADTESAAGTPAAVLADFCREELERHRDSDKEFDEELFRAAVGLALSRLQAHTGEDRE